MRLGLFSKVDFTMLCIESVVILNCNTLYEGSLSCIMASGVSKWKRNVVKQPWRDTTGWGEGYESFIVFHFVFDSINIK